MNFESTPIYAYFSKFTTPEVLGRSVPSSEFRRGIDSGNRPWFVSIAAGARAEKRRKSGYLNARGSILVFTDLRGSFGLMVHFHGFIK